MDIHSTRDPSSPPLTPAAAAALKLVVVEGPDAGSERRLETSITIGTDEACDLVMSDPAVSRRHLTFTRVGARVRVTDSGSRNGTYIGGTRIVEADVPLGTVLVIGDSSLALVPNYYVRELAPSPMTAFGGLLGVSREMREVYAVLERAAATDVTILIEGESGTGKELAARAVHDASGRANGPYVVFDCGSIPRELAESELFGHVRGAFTGADSDRDGAFARAHGGTLCLDEVGELPLDVQPKLLRALEHGSVQPVGADGYREFDVRVVAATNRELAAEAQRGAFRSDLLYRLEVVTVRLPPLRNRPKDIPILVKHFIAQLARGQVMPSQSDHSPNMAMLMNYAWPGNVRELRNTLERALALAPSPVAFDDLVFNLGPAAGAPVSIGSAYPGVASPMPFKVAKAQLLANFERAYVGSLMDRHKGNVTHAAEAAEISRKHLYQLLGRIEDA